MPSLTDAILKADKSEITTVLNLYKTENGGFNFPALLSISQSARLPVLAKSDPIGTRNVIVCGLTMAIESMNLARQMNESQIVDLAYAIIDASKEDFLSLEDVMLFLQGLTRGKYGPLYESMDIPKFMEKFEIYRQERHVEYENIKYEQHVNFKSLGPRDRESDNQDREKELHRSALGDHLKDLYKDK